MTGEPVSRDDLMALFEAAHWAPSCFNEQPWRFLYALRETESWDLFHSFLKGNNRVWAKGAGALVVILSRKSFSHNGKPSKTHSFDTGAAWGSLCLQGTLLGLTVHGMAGFDHGMARTALEVPEDFDLEAMAAVGYPGSPDLLPENLRSREFPSPRKPLSELAAEAGTDDRGIFL